MMVDGEVDAKHYEMFCIFYIEYLWVEKGGVKVFDVN
jgi:hypothetical protein